MNVLHILDIFDYMYEKKWNRINNDLVIHCLRGPEYYNIQNIPKELKEYIQNKYIQYINKIKYYNVSDMWKNNTKIKLNQIITYMSEENPDLNKWKLLKFKLEQLDSIRNENWKESLPELYNPIKNLDLWKEI